MNATYTRHGNYKPRLTPQEIYTYRQQHPATPTLPVLEPESPYDIRGNLKPQSRAWMSGKTIWFTLYRIAKPGHVSEGQWQPITRTMTATPERRKMVRRVLKARESAAAEMLDAAQAQVADFKLRDRVDAAIAWGQVQEMVAEYQEQQQGV